LGALRCRQRHLTTLHDEEPLNEALVDYFGEEFIELSEETELLHEEPRTLAEILEAEQEYFDKVWYVRALILEEKIKAGEKGRCSLR
jgi:hypothetical protein